eukprot:CAMPEP_0172499548 /NCGR_PEP_ID=MMETSP1066-20121228/128219_1 /TAXON_ID=671091 /ORGANISM="Coscinodiscus wailesii, Strain CCMP2513" /LENGTH=134 /DNA_ID=CAMNT_0013273333 /DNA_START=248 /DNA_END=650 /DNA_ORIENTATION=-
MSVAESKARISTSMLSPDDGEDDDTDFGSNDDGNVGGDNGEDNDIDGNSGGDYGNGASDSGDASNDFGGHIGAFCAAGFVVWGCEENIVGIGDGAIFSPFESGDGEGIEDGGVRSINGIDGVNVSGIIAWDFPL